MWQRELAPSIARGDLQVVGVVQEQHPDRAKLYAQWRQLSWPILVDSLNQLDMRVVPVVMGLDEAGVIRHVGMRLGDLKNFLALDPVSVQGSMKGKGDTDAANATSDIAMPAPDGDAEAWINAGSALFVRADKSALKSLPRVIRCFDQALAKDPRSGRAQFRKGVALRRLYEQSLSLKREESESPQELAQKAVDAWYAALEVDPDQYIWRRRLQQYGPRLQKPYNFYQWVDNARQEIESRGDVPVELLSEPMGSEVLAPEKNRSWGAVANESIERDQKISSDRQRLIEVATVVVPPRVQPGGHVRVRLSLSPDRRKGAKWNNEADDTRVQIVPDPKISIGEAVLSIPNPSVAESAERRVLEFELAIRDELKPGTYEFNAYALYYVCEGDSGKCRYLRQDIPIAVTVDKKAPPLG